MGWGAMAGLGQGLQNFATIWNEREKTKLADKLAGDREKAKEARAEALESRRVAETKMINRDGKWINQRINSFGNTISEEAATQDQITARERADKLAQLGLDKEGYATELAGKKTKNYDADRELELAEVRSRIAENNAQAAAAGRSNRGSAGGIEGKLTGGAGAAASVDAMVEQAKDVGVSEADIQRLRRQAAQMPTSGRRGVKFAPTAEEANQNFIMLLDEFIKNAQKDPGLGGLLRRRPGAIKDDEDEE